MVCLLQPRFLINNMTSPSNEIDVLLSLGSINPVMHLRTALILTALSDVKCLFLVIVYPCIPVAGFGAIFD